MSELPLRFGPDDSLVGVFNDAGGSRGVCCLLTNAGLVPRVGPNRLNVKIARMLAAQGMVSLRFDLAGLGDSRATTRATSYREQAVNDMREAMDCIEQKFGIRRFAIFGICSGAENALAAALADSRVAGILMLDGFWYRSMWSRPVRFLNRLRALTPARLAASIKRRLSRTGAKSEADAQAIDFLPADGSANPPRDRFAREMNELAARGASVFLLYTSTATEVTYARQIHDAFRKEPFVARLRCERHTDIDHTAVLLRAQQKLLGMISSWMLDMRTPAP
jgi:hypothetical protein